MSGPALKVFAPLVVLVLGMFPVCAEIATDPITPGSITNVAQIRELTAAQCAAAIPVHLNGVVITHADPPGRAIIMEDDTAGIYLLAFEQLFASVGRGDRLEVRGVTDPGQFAPIVKVTSVRRTGFTTVLPARSVTYQQLITGSLDAQWVEVSGVVRRYIPPEANSKIWRILIALDGGVVPVRSETAHDPAIQEDAEIGLRAICLYQFNQKRQVLTPVLQIANDTDITVTRPAPTEPFAAPVRSADSLLQFTPNDPGGHRVHVRGIVTHAQPGTTIWIRDRNSGLRLQSRSGGDLEAGDEIDVLGFPTYGAHSPTLEDAIFRKTGVTRPPAPLLITNTTALLEQEDNLVQTEAVLTGIQPILDGLAFNFLLDGTEFKGTLRMPASVKRESHWLRGSKLRITGICTLIHDNVRPIMGIWQPQSFQLLIRSPGDLRLITAPPWWTTERLTDVLAVTVGLLLLATGIVAFFIRRRMNEQSQRRVRAETEFAAILAERNRVAREIHDTLAQGLAATSVHLRLAKKHVETGMEKRNHHLEIAQQLVGESLEEARNSIWNMRSQVLETDTLPGALRGILQQMTDGSDLKVTLEVSGKERRFSPVIENNLLRVGQEAITNATRHSRARQIDVRLDFDKKCFRLAVRDDGAGFDPAKPPSSSGGFGLVGMRERAAELKGELIIESAPEKGTEVVLTVPLSGE